MTSINEILAAHGIHTTTAVGAYIAMRLAEIKNEIKSARDSMRYTAESLSHEVDYVIRAIDDDHDPAVNFVKTATHSLEEAKARHASAIKEMLHTVYLAKSVRDEIVAKYELSKHDGEELREKLMAACLD
jgi:hypothetical protein